MVMVVVHPDGKRSFNPAPDTVLRIGDELIVIGPEGGVNKMVGHFGEAAPV
jgi:K+/H+ antiporter YhaU regulatory subunit KhtT